MNCDGPADHVAGVDVDDHVQLIVDTSLRALQFRVGPVPGALADQVEAERQRILLVLRSVPRRTAVGLRQPRAAEPLFSFRRTLTNFVGPQLDNYTAVPPWP